MTQQARTFSSARRSMRAARSSQLASNAVRPTAAPRAARNVNAMRPPIKILSAHSSSAHSMPILSFAPPMMTANGLRSAARLSRIVLQACDSEAWQETAACSDGCWRRACIGSSNPCSAPDHEGLLAESPAA
jgi:hypothetical protein